MLDRGIVLLTAAALQSWPSAGADDPREIIARSVKRDVQNQQIIRDYTYKVLTKTTELDNAGKPKGVHSELQEVLYFGGKPHRRIIEKDGKPLPSDNERREQEKVNKVALEASKLTP